MLLLQELMNQQSTDQQRPLGETDTAVKPSQVNHVISYHRIVYIKLNKRHFPPFASILFDTLSTQELNYTKILNILLILSRLVK